MGGHARTIEVTSLDDRRLSIDMGVILMRPDVYPNLFQLFGELGVETVPTTVDIAVSFEQLGHIWGTGRGRRPTPFWRSIEEQARDFESEMSALFLDITSGKPPRFDPTRPVRDLFEARAYSSGFIDEVYCPLTSFLLVTRGGMRRPSSSPEVLLHCPLGTLALLFGSNALSFFRSTEWRTLLGGTKSYIDALWARVAPKLSGVRRGATSVRREGGLVLITDAEGTMTYDEVILATQADDARALLADIDEGERAVLHQFEYEPATVYLHWDEQVLSPSLTHDTFVEYSYRGGRVGPWLNGVMTYNMSVALGLADERTWLVSLYAGAPSMLPEPPRRASFSEHATPDPRKIACTQTWEHVIWSETAFLASAGLSRLQGRRHTWFCGSYAHLPAHEDAFVSGMIVAEALGAHYPFSRTDAGGQPTPWYARYADVSAWILGAEAPKADYFPLASLGR